MLALSLSLAACLGWGIADFIGGLKSKSLPTLTVLLLANLFGFTVVASVALFMAGPGPSRETILWSLIAGVSAAFTMVIFYKAMAVGRMSIVAPISATGVALPVIFGLVSGEPITGLQGFGLAAAAIGSILAGWELNEDGRSVATKGLGLAVTAAIAIGISFIITDNAAEKSPYWAAFYLRLAYFIIILGLALALKPNLRVDRRNLPVIAVGGILDNLAGFSFTIATSLGLLTIVSVVSSMYPVVTVLLSVFLLKERPARHQYLGVCLAILGIGFIAI